ncbi:MAG: hypothetical protein ABIO49_02930 [Dokdonella sp.]
MKIRTLVSIALSTAFAAVGMASAANGDLDPTFGSGGIAMTGVSDAAFALGVPPVVQSDGKILLCAGRSSNGASGSDFFVARFNANGTLDASFSFDGKVTIDFDGGSGSDQCNAVAVQSDGKIVVAGTTTNGANNSDSGIARLNADGTLDPTFGAGTGKTTVAFDLGGTNADTGAGLAIQPDGKIVVVGWANTASHGDDFAVVRLLSDGTRDSAFNLTGRVSVGFNLPGSASMSDQADSVAIDSAGRVLIGGIAQNSGNASNDDFAVVRLLPNGQLDADFDADGRATLAFDLGLTGNDIAYRMILQRDGKIVLAGSADSSSSVTANDDVAIGRLLPDGSPDASFGIGGKTVVPFDLLANGSDIAFGVLEQGNGKLVLAGATQYDAASHFRGAIARLNPDGSLDNQFGVLGKKVLDFGFTNPSNQLMLGVALQGTQIIASGLIVVPGTGAQDNIVVRLQNDLIFADGYE